MPHGPQKPEAGCHHYQRQYPQSCQRRAELSSCLVIIIQVESPSAGTKECGNSADPSALLYSRSLRSSCSSERRPRRLRSRAFTKLATNGLRGDRASETCQKEQNGTFGRLVNEPIQVHKPSPHTLRWSSHQPGLGDEPENSQT